VIVSAAATSVPPGGTITFRISAWSASTGNGDIATTLTLGGKAPVFGSPVFTDGRCMGNPASGNCDLVLPAQPPATPQIEAQLNVPKTTPMGETITFSALVSVASGSGAPLTATSSSPTVTVAQPPASPAPTSSTKAGAGTSPGSGASGSTPMGSTPKGSTPKGSTPKGSAADGSTAAGSAAAASTAGGLGAPIPAALEPVGSIGVALPIGAIPVAGVGTPITTNVPAGNAAGLFPEITPSSPAASAPGSGSGAKPGANSGVNSGQDAVATSSVVPVALTSSEFEAQIIGLMILLLGITVVLTGISVRKVRAAAKPSVEH
jgi:hypothetical protein